MVEAHSPVYKGFAAKTVDKNTFNRKRFDISYADNAADFKTGNFGSHMHGTVGVSFPNVVFVAVGKDDASLGIVQRFVAKQIYVACVVLRENGEYVARRCAKHL